MGRGRRGEILILALVMGMPGLFAYAANDSAQTFTLDGQLFQAGTTTPLLDATAKLTIQVLNPAKTCVLYEEKQTVDTSSTNGYFTVNVGSIPGDPKRGAGDSGNVMETVFQNVAAIPGTNVPLQACGGSYTPAAGATRYFRILVTPTSTNVAETLTPDMIMDSVPGALVAESVQGLQRASILTVRNDGVAELTQSNAENIFSLVNYPKLIALLSGTSPAYLSSTPSSSFDFNGQHLTNLALPTAATDATTKTYVDSNLGGKSVDLSGVGAGFGQGRTLTWDQTLAKWVTSTAAGTVTNVTAGAGLLGGSITSAGTLAVDVGTTAGKIVQLSGTGQLPAVDGFYLTNLNASRLAGRSIASTAPTSNQVLTFNSTTSLWQPQADLGITALNGDVVATGPGAVTATIQANSITAAKINNVGGGVNRLLITDAATGSNVNYASCTGTQILQWSALGWVCADISTALGPAGVSAGTWGSATQVPQITVDAQGRVQALTNLNIAFPVASVAGKTGVVALSAADISGLGTAATKDVGVLASNVVQLNGSAQLPAVDGSLLTNINVGTGGFKNGGNPFGAVSTLGNKDAFALNVITNNLPRITIDQLGNVGIGTTSPTDNLDVRASSSRNGIRLIDATTGVGLQLQSNFPALNFNAYWDGVSNRAIGPLYTGAMVFDPNVGNLYFYSGDNPGSGNIASLNNRMTLSKAGSVGIGTGNPVAALDVNSLGTASAIVVPRDTTANRPGGLNGMLRYNTSLGKMEAYESGAWTSYATSAGAANAFVSGGNTFGAVSTLGNKDNFALNLITNNLPRLTVDAAGNVGVGTASPVTSLQIAGSSFATGGLSLGDGTDGMYQSSPGNIQFVTGGQTRWSMGSSALSIALGSTPQFTGVTPNFRPRNGELSGLGWVGTQTVALYTNNAPVLIVNNSNVGVGTTSPQAALDITSLGTMSGVLLPRDTTANRPSGINGMLRYNVSLNKLEAFENGAWTSYSTTGGATGAFANGGNTFGGVSTLGNKDSYALNLVTAGANRVTVDQFGNVGIGTTSPAASLDVQGSGGINLNAGVILIGGNTLSNNSPTNGLTFDTAGRGNWVTGTAGVANNMTLKNFYSAVGYGSVASFGAGIYSLGSIGAVQSAAAASTGDLIFNTQLTGASSERMRITSTGNVGIGTTSPLAALDIGSLGTMSAILVPRDTTANRPSAVNGMIRYNTSLNKMEAYEAGAWTNMIAGGGGTGFVNGGNTFGAVSTLGNKDNFGLSLITNNLPRMTIDSSGNLGVGTASPAGILDVRGGTAATGTPGSTVNIVAQSAGPTGNNNGGDINLQSGSGTGTGSRGTVYLSGNVSIQALGFENTFNYGSSTGNPAGFVGAGKTLSVQAASPAANSSFIASQDASVWQGSNGANATVIGENGSVANFSPGNVGILEGGLFNVSTLGGTNTISTAVGVEGAVTNSTAGTTMTVAKGATFSVTRTAGTIGTGYGVYTGTIQATNKYSFYASDATAPSFFAGNVGIGTTSPLAALDISSLGTMSAVLIPRDTTANRPSGINGMLRYNVSLNKLESFENGAWTSYATTGGATGAFANGGNAFGGVSTLGNKDSYALNLITAGANRVTVDQFGNVGIGTTSPAATLQVAGEIQAGNSGLVCSTTTKGAMRYNNSTSQIEFCNGSVWGSVATQCAGTTPTTLTFTNLANQTVSTLVSSNIVQISGISCQVSTSISGSGTPAYRVCSDSGCSTVLQGWTSSPSSLSNGQYVQLQLTTSAIGGQSYSATMIVGNAASVWSAAAAGSCSGLPSTPPAIGTMCADGTIYAGTSPDTSAPMFTTPCDYGQTWNGTTCTGSALTVGWSTGSGTYTTTGQTNQSTGKANSAALAGYTTGGGYVDAPFTAAQVCNSLSTSGISQGSGNWYLPAKNELLVLQANAAAIGRFNLNYFWSSSEAINTNSYAMRMSDGTVTSYTKASSWFVRCVRR